MDINNNTNISNQIANSISKLTLSSAKRAFETAVKEPEAPDFKEDDIALIDKKTVQTSLKNAIDIEDIQKYANYMGENLTIDDINYGLMYGRSVIADYSA